MNRSLPLISGVVLLAATVRAGVLRVDCTLQANYKAEITYAATAWYEYGTFDFQTPDVSGVATLFKGGAVDQHALSAVPGHPDIASGQWSYTGAYYSCYNAYAEAWEDLGGTSQAAGSPLFCTQGPPTWTLTLNSNVDGSVSYLRDEQYEDGTQITLTPVTPTNYTFAGWSGDVNSSQESVTFRIYHDMSVTANFVQYQPPSPGSGDGTYQRSESCPLILDLNGDGIHTTGLDDPVHFWVDLAGRNEATAWTNPATEEAFLWIDLNDDHVAQVTELFGSRMRGPKGDYHAHGFEALAKYDQPAFGGDGDGQITPKDWVWARLKLWVDRNHDGISQPTEISVPSSHGIVALNIAYVDGDTYDEHGNELYLVGSYVVRTHGNQTAERMMADIEFRYIPNGDLGIHVDP